jgi:hypothetical protein
MHKLKDACWLKAKRQVLEYWGCRVCPRRWRRRRHLARAVRLPSWRIAVLVWAVLMGVEILLLSGLLEGPDAGGWERPY